MAIEEFLKAKLGIIENERNGIKFLIYPTGKAGGLTDNKLDLYINLPQKGKPNNLRTNPEETLKMMKIFIDDYLKKQKGIDVASAKVKKSNDTTAYDVTVPITFKESVAEGKLYENEYFDAYHEAGDKLENHPNYKKLVSILKDKGFEPDGTPYSDGTGRRDVHGVWDVFKSYTTEPGSRGTTLTKANAKDINDALRQAGIEDIKATPSNSYSFRLKVNNLAEGRIFETKTIEVDGLQMYTYSPFKDKSFGVDGDKEVPMKYAGEANNLDDIMKLVSRLPDTVKELEVPYDLYFGPSLQTFKYKTLTPPFNLNEIRDMVVKVVNEEIPTRMSKAKVRHRKICQNLYIKACR